MYMYEHSVSCVPCDVHCILAVKSQMQTSGRVTVVCISSRFSHCLYTSWLGWRKLIKLNKGLFFKVGGGIAK